MPKTSPGNRSLTRAWLLPQSCAGFFYGDTLMLSFEEADQLLSYDPVSGLLTRKVRRGRFQAGTVAGTLRFQDKGVGNTWYITVGICGKRYMAHRICWLLYHGVWPDGEIDHENHVGTDNWIDNLRDVSLRVNSKNKRVYRSNTSGCPGVYWLKKKRRWQVVICVLGKRIYLGRYTTLEEAVFIRKKHELIEGFHPNHGTQYGITNS